MRFYKALANPIHLANPLPEERENEYLFHFINIYLGYVPFYYKSCYFFQQHPRTKPPAC